jgi:hypothetical protein
MAHISVHSSWLNRIRARFTYLLCFTFDGMAAVPGKVTPGGMFGVAAVR